MRVLVVDDEDTLCQALRFNLEAEGLDVDTALSAEEALRLPLASYDLAILDVMLPGMDGFQLGRHMKDSPSTAHVPIIFCTAKDRDDDMVDGLDLGADDYVTKPYSLRTLMARVRAVLRRSQASQAAGDAESRRGVVQHQGIAVDLDARQVTVDGTPVRMPRKEMEILVLLLTHPGHVYSRAEILKAVWEEGVVVCDRNVDINITRLRQKLGPYGPLIVTRPGYGYGFQPRP